MPSQDPIHKRTAGAPVSVLERMDAYQALVGPRCELDGTQLAFECDDPDTDIHICFVTVATGVVTESVLGENPAWEN